MRYQNPLVPMLLLTLAGTLEAQGLRRVAPSGQASTAVSLTFVDSAARASSQPAEIRIDYGQPHLRGRRLLTDSLVPYDTPWRTGANAATTLTTDVDLIVGGATVPKGKYVLQTLPSRAGWKLLIQKDMGQSPMMAAMSYDPANDIARVDLRVTTTPTPLESLTIWLIPSREPGPPRGELRLAWGTIALATDWSVPATAASPSRQVSSTPSAAEADSATVAGVVSRFHAALASGDSTGAMALLAPDAVVLESGGVETRAEYQSHHLQGDIGYAKSMKTIRGPIRVSVRGDVAWTSSTSTTTGESRGRKVDSTGAELMVLTRTGSGWRISAIHWSSRAQRPPA